MLRAGIAGASFCLAYSWGGYLGAIMVVIGVMWLWLSLVDEVKKLLEIYR